VNNKQLKLPVDSMVPPHHHKVWEEELEEVEEEDKFQDSRP